MEKKTPGFHIKRAEALKTARSGLDSYAQEAAYYCMPRKSFITRYYNLGDRMPTDLFDSTAINSVDYAAAGIQGYLTNPATRWFGLAMQNRWAMEIPGARDYLRDCEDVIYDIFNRSNFYQENAECYRDLLVLPSHVLYIEEDLEDDARYMSVPYEKCYFSVDYKGRVSTMYVYFEFNAEQAVDKFTKEKLPKKIQECYEKLEFSQKFTFLLCVYKRAVYDPSKKDRRNMPIAAEWIETESETLVREGGYRSFPFMKSVWAKVGTDGLGNPPAFNELPNIKTLNAMCRTNLIAGESAADPAKIIPDEVFMRPYDFDAGGINIKAAGYPNEKIEVVPTSPNVPFALDYEDARRRMIQQAFFNDLFIVLNSNRDMTAEEVRARVAERMLLLGPVIGIIIRDVLRPAVERTYDLAAAAKKLPPAPEGLKGMAYTVIATSPLARAQREVELKGMQMGMQIIFELAQAQLQAGMQPEVLDKFDFDQAADFAAEVTDLNPKLIRDDAEVEELRSNRQQSQMIAQKMQLIQQSADAIKTGTEADKNLKETAAA